MLLLRHLPPRFLLHSCNLSSPKVTLFSPNSLTGFRISFFRGYGMSFLTLAQVTNKAIDIAEKTIKTPYMADSITQGTLANWEKKLGEFVNQDETVANIETDKVTIPVNSPESGILAATFAKPGDTVQVGSDLFKLDLDGRPSQVQTLSQQGKDASAPPPPVVAATTLTPPPPARPGVEPLRPPSQSIVLEQAEKEIRTLPPTRSLVLEDERAMTSGGKISRAEHRERLTRMRLRISERMKESQNVAASLTTFNEIDMSTLIGLRNRLKDEVIKKHNVKFGFMSPFVKATAQILKELPIVNARLDMNSQEIVFHDYVDISVAVATPKGLVTPVLRNCEGLGMVGIERAIQELSERARENKLALEDLSGGTFTISNGGVFGSLMGTPIINVPQSAILGMHSIKERPIVIDGKIEIRPMMYVALTYDHRLIDGREAVTFLVRLKQILEDPHRLLLDL